MESKRFYKKLVNWLNKRNLISLLRSRSRKANVLIYIEDDCFVLQYRELGRIFTKNPIFLACKASATDMIFLRSYVRNGSFLVYKGSEQAMLDEVIEIVRRSEKVITWTEDK